MTQRLLTLGAGIFALFLLQNCTDTNVSTQITPPVSPTPSASAVLAALPAPVSFDDYWYQGKAEISTYDVVQERYGETRSAEQVNVFVTEDFSKKKQVKLDDAASAGNDRAPVLKLNAVRRFHTGIYDYSIMSSVFSPVDGSPALKTTCTVQDWCGQVFFQTNLEKSGVRARSFSYFETESDTDLRLPLTLLEDELWTKIRLGPDKIPVGKINVLPSSIYVRLRHKPFQPESVEVKIEQAGAENILKINYLNIPRALSIRYETASPYRILGWEETGANGAIQSKGTLKASRMSAYWAEHDNVHLPLRDSLKLKF